MMLATFPTTALTLPISFSVESISIAATVAEVDGEGVTGGDATLRFHPLRHREESYLAPWTRDES